MNQPSPMNITPGTTPGATPSGSTPNGAPKARPRKPQKPADPFVRRKPPPKRREAPAESQARKNKPQHEKDKFFSVQAGAINSALVAVNTAIPIVDSSSGITTSGFSTAAPGNYKDYPVFITKGQLKERLRHHAARFLAKTDVNPTQQSEWTQPVRLYRRDPKMPVKGEKLEEPDSKEVELQEEQEKQQMLREQRQAQRAAEMSEIAPSLSGQPPKKFGKDQKKFVEVRRKDETEAKRAASQLSYEEALPWHFEDDENKQVWSGTYEAALSEAHAQFAIKGDRVELQPLQKWYKFTQQRTFKSQEELEALEAKRYQKDPDFLRKWEEKQENLKQETALRQAASKLWQVGGNRTANFKSSSKFKADHEDADELDFDEDVADDEEDAVYEGDGEETKETQKRIKKDQLKANIFNMKEEGSYDEEDEEERKAREARKLIGKTTNKLLIKQENNRLYASDSDISSSDDEDPDVKKDGEKTEAEKQKLASGASSKGTNTPSGRKEKHRSMRSQEQSEASGNESSRPRLKKNGVGSALASGRNTPNGATSRSLSPGPGGGLKPPSLKGNSALKRPRAPGAGSGSDGEGAGSGGEMSDGSRKRLKLRGSVPGSQNVSPGGSRATSPSRDPVVAAPKPTPTLPTVEQIRASVPEGGLLMADFLRKWNTFIKSEAKPQFMKIMKLGVKLDKRDTGTWIILSDPVKASSEDP